MFKIFIIEDDKEISEAISYQLSLWNMESSQVDDFSNVLSEFVNYNPDLVLMDISLPLFDGYHWCNEIRKISKTPIIFLSSANENMNIIMAMNLGGDDFISKPFEINVLIAKIQALLRRTYDYKIDSEIVEYKGLILNIANNSLMYQDENIELSKNEYRILLTLIQNKGKIVSREKLMDILWKTDVYIDENTLNVNVNRLRKKLDDVGVKDIINTRFKQGYIIE